jgi:hypothetical protein
MYACTYSQCERKEVVIKVSERERGKKGDCVSSCFRQSRSTNTTEQRYSILCWREKGIKIEFHFSGVSGMVSDLFQLRSQLVAVNYSFLSGLQSNLLGLLT